MRKFLILAAGIAAFTSFAPASYAQGIAVDTPVGGVRIGDPGYRHGYRSYDGPMSSGASIAIVPCGSAATAAP